MLVLEFIFRALPHIFQAKAIQLPSKNGPYAYGSAVGPSLIENSWPTVLEFIKIHEFYPFVKNR